MSRHLDIQELMTARPVTAADADAILDIYGTNAVGRPQHERAVIQYAKDVKSNVEQQHANAVRLAEAEMEERAAAIAEAFDAADAAVKGAARDLEAGRIDARTARARLAKADEARRTLAARVEQLKRDDVAANELAEQSPAEWQAEMLQRYPALRTSLPVMTRAALAEHA